MLRGVVDGVGPDEAAARLTHERIRTYAAETPTVYLPTMTPRPRLASPSAGPSGPRGRGRSRDQLRDQRPDQAPDRGGLRLRLGPDPVPALELGSADGAQHLWRDGRAGSTYSMERELPTGRVENGLKVFAREHPNEFGIRTTTGPTPFVYHYGFASDRAATIVHLEATVELPGVAGVLGPLASRGIRRGVDANFADLKRTLEGSARSA